MMKQQIPDHESRVNNLDTKTYYHDDVREAVRELAHARGAIGYEESETVAFVMINVLIPLGVAHYEVIPPEKCREVVARLKHLLAEHLINVSLAIGYEVGSQLEWGGHWPHIHAQNAFRMKDLLDLRLGVEGANKLIGNVRELLEHSRWISAPLLDAFLSRRRAGEEGSRKT
jgi:hypothetical protein